MLHFDFLLKRLGLVCPTNFVYDFPGKILFILNAISGQNIIFWLALLLEILDNAFRGP